MAAIARRHRKYVWACTPSVLVLLGAAMWAMSVAPDEQARSRDLRDQLSVIDEEKARQDALRDANLGTDFKTLFLNGFVDGRDDPSTIVPRWIEDPRIYPQGAVIELKDTYDGCIGFIANQKVYTEADNPGMCEMGATEKKSFYDLLNQLKD